MNYFPQTTPTRHTPLAKSNRRGFTLIEILVSLVIVGILTTIVVASVGAGKQQANAAREVSALKSLVATYTAASVDYRGKLMPGMRTGTSGVGSSRWSEGIRQYYGGNYKNTLYINDQAAVYDNLVGNDYMLSLYPSFGMNYYYVGGTQSDSSLYSTTPHAVTRPSEAISPSELIVFSSACSEGTGKNYGYLFIRDPYSRGWPSALAPDTFPTNSRADVYGNVAFRNKGKAAVAFLDGHVAMLDSNEMSDMRLWSNDARRENNRNYRPPVAE